MKDFVLAKCFFIVFFPTLNVLNVGFSVVSHFCSDDDSVCHLTCYSVRMSWCYLSVLNSNYNISGCFDGSLFRDVSFQHFGFLLFPKDCLFFCSVFCVCLNEAHLMHSCRCHILTLESWLYE